MSSVFNKIKQTNKLEQGIVETIINIENENNNNNIPCLYGHTIDGIYPTVDENKFEIQNPQFIGRKCDCGNLTYVGERTCGCEIKKWIIEWD